MTSPSTHHVTKLLQAWSDGDEAALEELTPLVYRELHRLAKRYMARERGGHTLQTSALVNEAFMRLTDWKNVEWRNRAHFFAMSARMMRHILVDFARSKRVAKRGGAAAIVPIDEALATATDPREDLVALDDALQRLATLDERQSRVVELRFFGGLTLDEIADVLDVSVGTVRRDWSLARAWLYRDLAASHGDVS